MSACLYVHACGLEFAFRMCILLYIMCCWYFITHVQSDRYYMLRRDINNADRIHLMCLFSWFVQYFLYDLLSNYILYKLTFVIALTTW